MARRNGSPTRKGGSENGSPTLSAANITSMSLWMNGTRSVSTEGARSAPYFCGLPGKPTNAKHIPASQPNEHMIRGTRNNFVSRRRSRTDRDARILKMSG